MFDNIKITFKMASPIAVTNFLHIDSILAAAYIKENLGEEYFNRIANNTDFIEFELPLDKKYGVYCASIGIGDHREFMGSWCKRWDDKNDDIVKFSNKVKQRIDIGSGYFKSYHIPLIIKSYKEIVFYIRGDIKQVDYLLNKHIFYIGKKASQAYGEIREIIIEKVNYDYSMFKDGYPMRPIPVRQYSDYIKQCVEEQKEFTIDNYSVKLPYWRTDFIEMCFMPRI
jgi:CRISPR type IV-associated protein Csf3